MKKKHRLTRREFLGQTGAAALGAVALGGDVAAQTRSVAPPQAIGANDLIDLAVIGHGMRGPQLIDQIRGLPRGAGARIAAVCEIYDRRKESIQRQARLSECVHDYRDLLAMDSIDALVIAVPDHWHLRMAVEAMRAGKDVFLEKPMTLTWREAKEVRDVARETGRVVQIGAGSASDDIWHQARELIGDGGAGPIGKPLHFQTSYNRNVPGGDWNYEIFEDANAQTVDWERWQAPAARHRAWEDGGAERFFRFRKYWDYSGGLATDLLYHKLAHMALALGFPFPRRVSAVGGKYLHFDRDVPDTLTVQAEFENNCIGTLLATSGNDLNIEEAIRGEHGTMTFERGALVVRPQRAHMAAVAEKASKLEDVEIVEGRSGGRTVIESIRRRARPRSEHMLNFIECMRSRGKPHLDAEAGYRVMTTIGLSVEAYREGRTKRFDPAREETIES